jgi:hypothetical protein
MKENIDEKPVSNWAVAGVMLGFLVAFAVWAAGFDLVASWLAGGGGVDAVLSWMSNAWYWCVICMFTGCLIFKRIMS